MTIVRKKKILLIRNAYRQDFGGGERIPVDMAIELEKNGYETVVVSRSEKLLQYAKTSKANYLKGWWWSMQDWSGVKMFLAPLYFIWQVLLLGWYLRIISMTKADIIHPQSRDDFIAATIAALLMQKRVIWTDHADLKYLYRNHTIWYKNPIGKIVFILSKYAYAIIIVSKSELAEISKSLGRETPRNYRVIYNGVKSEPIEPSAKLDADKKAIVLGATSRLVISKGIYELIEAFNLVSTDNTSIKLWLFGDGPDESLFKQAAKNNSRIIFKGFPADALNQLASCDIFVHPSYHEGFSVSLIEAAKLGLPIIACDVGGNAELVKDNENGMLVQARDPHSLAAAMRLLINDEQLRKKYGHKSSEIYTKSFVFENIIRKKIVPLYE